MGYPKRLIIVRHGETSLNKKNQQRRLTAKGQDQMKLAGQEILDHLKNEPCLILSNNVVRSKESAQLISATINAPLKIVSELKIQMTSSKSLERKIRNNPLGLSPGAYYLQLCLEDNLPQGIKRPGQVTGIFLAILKTHRQHQNLIIVGHEGSLDALLHYQSIYHQVLRKGSGPLSYGEMVLFSNLRKITLPRVVK